jgi:hypothetical protein
MKTFALVPQDAEMSCLVFDCTGGDRQQVIERLLPGENIDFSG